MIEITNLTKIFTPGNVAVEQVSFSVAQGTITCLIGPSGCGKTTILKMINRLVEPTLGKIHVNGINAQTQDLITLRRSIGYILQGGSLMPHMTVRQNIALPAEIVKAPLSQHHKHEKVDQLMHMVGLAPSVYASRYPDELSGGQQQRVGIARALMVDPPVLLMDEPFGALDPIIKFRLWQEFKQLNQQLQKTILLVTHDLAEAFFLANDIILINKGKIVQRGTPQNFLNNPTSDFAAEFIQAYMAGHLS